MKKLLIYFVFVSIAVICSVSFYSCKKWKKGVVETMTTYGGGRATEYCGEQLLKYHGTHKSGEIFKLSGNDCVYWEDKSLRDLGYTDFDGTQRYYNKAGKTIPGKGGYWANSSNNSSTTNTTNTGGTNTTTTGGTNTTSACFIGVWTRTEPGFAKASSLTIRADKTQTLSDWTSDGLLNRIIEYTWTESAGYLNVHYVSYKLDGTDVLPLPKDDHTPYTCSGSTLILGGVVTWHK